MGIHDLGGLPHFVLPRFELCLIEGPRPQHRITLPQCPAIALPRRKKTMFHVKHAPVEKTPPRVGRATDQGMAARFEAHHGTMAYQVADTIAGLAIHANAPSRIATPQTQATNLIVGMSDLAIRSE